MRELRTAVHKPLLIKLISWILFLIRCFIQPVIWVQNQVVLPILKTPIWRYYSINFNPWKLVYYRCWTWCFRSWPWRSVSSLSASIGGKGWLRTSLTWWSQYSGPSTEYFTFLKYFILPGINWPVTRLPCIITWSMHPSYFWFSTLYSERNFFYICWQPL